MSIANVTLSNTFDEWRVRHNVITINVNDLQDNTAGLNVVAANTIYAYQRVRSAPGTENAPSVTFNTDVGSGMYSPANGQLGFSTNNVNALLFDKNRNATFSNNVTLKTLTINTGNAITGVDYSGVSNNNTVLPTSRVVLVELGNYTSNTYAQNTFSQLGHSHTLSDITDSGAAAAKSVTGADSAVVTGTAGTNGNIIQWNVDGDAVDSGQSTSGVSNHISSTNNPHNTTASQVSAVENVASTPGIQADTRANQPSAGTAGLIYIVTNEQIIERDNGSSWESLGVASTDDVPEGNMNLYYTNARASNAAPVQSVNGFTGTVTGLMEGNLTISTNNPSGGADGDMWLKVV